MNANGPIISPDGSFISHINPRTTTGGQDYYIPRVNSTDSVYILDEYLMDALGQNNNLYAFCPISQVSSFYGIATSSTYPYLGTTTNWCGFEEGSQMWEWGMRGTWFEEYGPE